MNKEKLKKIFIILITIFAAFVVSFYFLAEDQLRYKNSANNIIMPDADSITPEITNKVVIEQTFTNNIDIINHLEIVFTKFYRQGSGYLTIQLLDGENVLLSKVLDVREIPEQHRVYVDATKPLENMRNKELTIKVSSTSKEDFGAAIMMRKEGVDNTSIIKINDDTIAGQLCFSLIGNDYIVVGRYYWLIMGCVGLALGLLLFISYRKYTKGRINYIVSALLAVDKYSFLISQLVIRDFKSKYKRSILGIFWSFLNPLLTMTVQFLVFSTFFSADTKNYPIYLLTGVIFYSFFNECTTMCLSSISGNANLITKVYVPKYIFPLARAISSSVNLFISIVPLLLGCLVLGVVIKPQFILFLYFVICLMIFALGIGLFLSALMVFFRDIQFLWTVIIQIWQYATPIFYPAEIIPDKYRFILVLNPIYHFIGNARTCIMNGVSPEPRSYIFCLLFALLSLFIGAFTFKKTQDRFALYL